MASGRIVRAIASVASIGLMCAFVPQIAHAADGESALTFPVLHPVTGDWDGVGGDGPGVVVDDGRRLIWHLRNAPTFGPPDYIFEYGTSGDFPVTGDWDGVGGDGIGITRAVGMSLEWHLRLPPGPGPADYVFGYGVAGDFPVTGDWDGVGGDGIGITRAVGTSLQWHLRLPPGPGPANRIFDYGSAGDYPVTGDWDGVGGDGPGVTNVFGGTRRAWYLRLPPDSGPAQYIFEYGGASDFPVTGDWDDVGGDGVGITRSIDTVRLAWHLRQPPAPGPANYIFEYSPAGTVPGVIPQNGMLVRQHSEQAVYYIEDGRRFWVPTPEILAAMGLDSEDVLEVADGALNAFPRGPDIAMSDFAGEARLRDPLDAGGSASGWRTKDHDLTHLDSADGKARLVGGVNWYNGEDLKFYLHRGDIYRGTRARAIVPVGCIWAQVKFGYPVLQATFFPPTLSIGGAAEVGRFYRSCREGSETMPPPIDLTGISYAKALLSSVTLTVCTSDRAADGQRNCGTEKELYGDTDPGTS